MVIGLVIFGDMTFSGIAIFLFAGVFLTLIIANLKPKTERKSNGLIMGEVSRLKDEMAAMDRRARAVPLEAFFITPAYRPVNRYVTAPNKPGLGFDIDWDIVEKYAVKESPTSSLYY
jgi:hypothetical protein